MNGMNSDNPPSTRCAVVGIVGRTNSGKSTLVNKLVGEKVSIVSPVVQTTRNTIRAIVDEPRGQLVLTDTPGLHKAESKLGTLINRMARHAAANVEILVVVFDVSNEPHLEDDGWMRRVLADPEKRPCIFFMNKTDRPSNHEEDFHKLWESIKKELGEAREVTVFSGSAVTGRGTGELIDALFKFAQPSERLYDPDILSDYPRRLAMADVIREKLFLTLHKELPHEVGVRIDDFHEGPERWDVHASLLVSRESQKPIIIGPKGHFVRKVRMESEKELSEQYDVKVVLDLRVKVDKNWTTNNYTLRQMGYIGEY